MSQEQLHLRSQGPIVTARAGQVPARSAPGRLRAASQMDSIRCRRSESVTKTRPPARSAAQLRQSPIALHRDVGNAQRLRRLRNGHPCRRSASRCREFSPPQFGLRPGNQLAKRCFVIGAPGSEKAGDRWGLVHRLILRRRLTASASRSHLFPNRASNLYSSARSGTRTPSHSQSAASRCSRISAFTRSAHCTGSA